MYPHHQFLIQPISISLVKLHVAFSVVNFFLNTYCSFVKILYFIKCYSSLVCIAFFNYLGREVKGGIDL